MTLSALREVLDVIDGDPREFVAAFEAELERSGVAPMLWVAVQRWRDGESLTA